MRQYNIFQAIFMSFYSRNLYRDVALNWGGKTFLYLLMLLSLSWIYFVVQVQIVVNQQYEKQSDKFISQIPVLIFKNGKVSTPEPQPYYIVDPYSHKNIAIIDTTGKYTSLDQANVPMLLTQTEFLTQQKDNSTKTYKLPDKFNYVMDPKALNSYMIEYVRYAWVLTFIFVVIGSFIYRIIQALLYGLIGKFFSSMVSVPLKYGQIMQITLVAVTPAIILGTIQGILKIYIPYIWIAYFLLSLFYIFYGILANRNPSVITGK
jgi:hypothetical protein